MVIPLKVDDSDAEAVVDSGAQATVMSDEFYRSLKNPPKITEKVLLKTASKGDGFKGYYVPKATLTFGKISFTCSMYVGPVTDPFILGLDFLLPVEGVIDLGRHTVTVKDKHGNVSVHNSGESMKVCRLTLERRTVVPPMSKIGISAHVEDFPSEWEGKDVVTQPLSHKELLAVVRFAEQYKHYLLSGHFYVRTDHSSLAWLMRFKNVEGQLAHWLEVLSQFNMTILHRAGSKHCNADPLSRIPDDTNYCNCYQAGVNPEDLPCQGCKYCTRAQ